MSKTEPQSSRIQAIPEQAPKVSATKTHTKQYKRTEAAGGEALGRVSLRR